MGVVLELGKWYLRDDGCVVGPCCENANPSEVVRRSFPFLVSGFTYDGRGGWIGGHWMNRLLEEREPVFKSPGDLIELGDFREDELGMWLDVPCQWIGWPVGDKRIQKKLRVKVVIDVQ